MIDGTARVLDIDPATRAEVDAVLAAMTDAERGLAADLCDEITRRIGTFPRRPVNAQAPDSAWVAAYLGAAPAVHDWMRDRGIPDSTICSTLSDVGRHLRLHRRHTGRVGFDAPIWPSVVLTGSLYELGRLQFDLRSWRPDKVIPGVEVGSWVLNVHIPETGPLSPDVVADSFVGAVDFFDTHFPDRRVRIAVCASWLLDPHLGEHLSPASNMARFQRLFTSYGEPRDDELDAMYFTFGQRSLEHLDRLPRDSSLQRLVLDRLARGERWQVSQGYRHLRSR